MRLGHGTRALGKSPTVFTFVCSRMRKEWERERAILAVIVGGMRLRGLASSSLKDMKFLTKSVRVHSSLQGYSWDHKKTKTRRFISRSDMTSCLDPTSLGFQRSVSAPASLRTQGPKSHLDEDLKHEPNTVYWGSASVPWTRIGMKETEDWFASGAPLVSDLQLFKVFPGDAAIRNASSVVPFWGQPKSLSFAVKAAPLQHTSSLSWHFAVYKKNCTASIMQNI